MVSRMGGHWRCGHVSWVKTYHPSLEAGGYYLHPAVQLKMKVSIGNANLQYLAALRKTPQNTAQLQVSVPICHAQTATSITIFIAAI